jgi:hypothetical protein
MCVAFSGRVLVWGNLVQIEAGILTGIFHYFTPVSLGKGNCASDVSKVIGSELDSWEEHWKFSLLPSRQGN